VVQLDLANHKIESSCQTVDVFFARFSYLGENRGSRSDDSNLPGRKTRISLKWRGILYTRVCARSFEAGEGIGRDSVGF
jgi:hypothetical protein